MRVFITGGTSGLGLALTKHYLSQNCRVGISSIESLEKIQDVIPSGVVYYQADVTDTNRMQEVINDFAKNQEGLMNRMECILSMMDNNFMQFVEVQLSNFLERLV